jgi:ribokinase
MAHPDIVVVGSYNRDVSLSVAHMPAPGETMLSMGRLEAPGGKGSNQAIQAARCGARTAMIAAIGRDGAGEEALALWAAEGIDAAGVARLDGHGTGLAMILVDGSGENLIVVDSGANAHLGEAHVDAAAAAIRGARLVAAQLETPVAATRRAFAIARAAGVATLLNAAPAPEAIDAELLALTDILVVNEIEGRALSGHATPAAIGETLLGRVGRAVVVTLGGAGAMLFEHGRPPLKAAPPAVEVVDTTGAGDAFTGAFAARLTACGDAASALAWGLTAGSLACMSPGAAASCAGAEAIAVLAAKLESGFPRELK